MGWLDKVGACGSPKRGELVGWLDKVGAACVSAQWRGPSGWATPKLIYKAKIKIKLRNLPFKV